MGNRLEEGVCLQCGGPIIELNPQWQFCTECLKEVRAQIAELKLKAKPGADKKTHTFKMRVKR